MKPRRSWLAALSVAALAVPAAAVAHPGHGHANGHGTHNVQYIFKGTYEGDGVVNVDHGNRHARNAGLVGDDVHVQFDLTNTNLDVAETNTDGVVDGKTSSTAIACWFRPACRGRILTRSRSRRVTWSIRPTPRSRRPRPRAPRSRGIHGR